MIILGAWNHHAVTQLIVMAAEADPLNVLLNYGGLGLGILLFITGQLHSKGELQDVKDQRDKLMEINEEMRRQMTSQTLPTLGGMTEVLQAMSERYQRASTSAPPSDSELLREVLRELKQRNSSDGNSDG